MPPSATETQTISVSDHHQHHQQTQDQPRLQPTKTFYIAPHGHFTSTVQVHDLTDKLQTAFPADAWTDEAEQIGESLADADPTYTLIQPGWLGAIKVYNGDAEERSRSNTLASWKPTARGHARQVFEFPAGSKHAGHALTLAPAADGTYEFVMDSFEYIWRYDEKAKRRLSLWKRIGAKDVQVAEYRSPQRFMNTGGALAVDEKEVDGLVAILSCCAMLRKGRSM